MCIKITEWHREKKISLMRHTQFPFFQVRQHVWSSSLHVWPAENQFAGGTDMHTVWSCLKQNVPTLQQTSVLHSVVPRASWHHPTQLAFTEKSVYSEIKEITFGCFLQYFIYARIWWVSLLLKWLSQMKAAWVCCLQNISNKSTGLWELMLSSNCSICTQPPKPQSVWQIYE